MITTSLREEEGIVKEAKDLAAIYDLHYVPRHKTSLMALAKGDQGLFVLNKEGLSFSWKTGERLFFHPDTAVLRYKAPYDPLLDWVGERPKSVLDVTLGLASDSLLLARAGHQVVGLESERVIYLVTSYGLKHYPFFDVGWQESSARITCLHKDNLAYMREIPDKTYDILYLDPMFVGKIRASNNLAGLYPLANTWRPDEAWLEEAKRITKEAIILKAHFRDSIFEDLGFKRQRRPNQLFHYGILISELF